LFRYTSNFGVLKIRRKTGGKTSLRNIRYEGQ
jgi:hypothetical protein